MVLNFLSFTVKEKKINRRDSVYAVAAKPLESLSGSFDECRTISGARSGGLGVITSIAKLLIKINKI